jgi:hypothetical protein
MSKHVFKEHTYHFEKSILKYMSVADMLSDDDVRAAIDARRSAEAFLMRRCVLYENLCIVAFSVVLMEWVRCYCSLDNFIPPSLFLFFTSRQLVNNTCSSSSVNLNIS